MESIETFFLENWWHVLEFLCASFFSWREIHHSREANRLRRQSVDLQEQLRANTARIAELQSELNSLQGDRNRTLERLVVNTQRVPTEAESNAKILLKYVGKTAFISEGGNNWGAMGALIAEVDEHNIATLFVPSGFYSTQAFSQRVQCNKLQITEPTTVSSKLQLNILDRYGSPVNHGEAKTWEQAKLV